MAPRARTVLPLTILLLHLLALGDVSAKKDPLRNRRVGDGPFRDLLKIDEDDEGGKGNRSVKNHALRHRKAAVKFKDDNDEEEEEEEEVSLKARLALGLLSTCDIPSHTFRTFGPRNP